MGNLLHPLGALAVHSSLSQTNTAQRAGMGPGELLFPLWGSCVWLEVPAPPLS